MMIKDLQDQLRNHIRTRIQRGEWTGSSLSGKAGFQQGHLSNFLNARRGLSLEAMDRLLEVLNIGILDLLKAEDVRRAVLPGAPARVEEVALVSAEHAALARFGAHQILETHSFSRSFLRKLKPNDAGDRAGWLRFVLIRLDAGSAGGILPLEISQLTLLIDRHYCSLKPYRRLRPNLYALRVAERCFPGYVSVSGDHLVLRPSDPRAAVAVVRIERGRSYSDYILGRVCHVGAEV